MIHVTFEEYGKPYSTSLPPAPNTYTSAAPQTYLEVMAILWDLEPKVRRWKEITHPKALDFSKVIEAFSVFSLDPKRYNTLQNIKECHQEG